MLSPEAYKLLTHYYRGGIGFYVPDRKEILNLLSHAADVHRIAERAKQDGKVLEVVEVVEELIAYANKLHEVGIDLLTMEVIPSSADVIKSSS